MKKNIKLGISITLFSGITACSGWLATLRNTDPFVNSRNFLSKKSFCYKLYIRWKIWLFVGFIRNLQLITHLLVKLTQINSNNLINEINSNMKMLEIGLANIVSEIKSKEKKDD